jgi:DNA-binding SARP family transcriptional activator/predicted ATPase
MAAMRIELFNNLLITCAQQPVLSVNTNRLQSLLAWLVLNSEAAQPREQVAFLLWPESIESQARTNLRQLLHHLRRALPAECCYLEADNHSVQWRRDPACTIDVVEFDAAVARAADAAKRGNTDGERAALEEAACLYQDDLLRSLYDDWLLPEREHYRRQLLHALLRLALLLEERRDYPAAIRHAERLVALDPLAEAHHQVLIRLHAGHHDRASALRAFHQCKQVLRRELGVDPDAATRELFDQVLRSEPLAGARAELPPTVAESPAPMVGRGKEWEQLLECWRGAVRGGKHLALIEGEPGIGKTRLAEELYEWCSHQEGAVARARCYSASGRLAYAPIAGWLRSEPLSAACAQLAQAQLAELARVMPEILAQYPTLQRPHPLAESWERRHFYHALNAAFGKARGPLLLLIDDLQWCDPDSFEWLHSLFRSDLVSRILVVGTVRPEETGRTHPLAGLLSDLRQSGQAVELPLSPLNAEETAALAAQVADRPLDAADLGALYRATKGNPLFVVESVRAGLRDPAAKGADLSAAAPPRIHAVITARLAQLSPAAYELAGLTSAMGQTFTLDLLAKSTDWDDDSLSAALDELWQRRIIEGQGEEHGVAQYDFTHDRLREVAYAELSPVRRRFLHRRIARALEELHEADPESISGQLAAHCEAAGMAEPAIRHYLAAAAEARHRYADAEAAGLLRRALALCRNFPETTRRDHQELELLVTLGPVLVTTQGYSTPEVGELYERALLLSRGLGEKEHVFPVLSGAWVFHAVRGQLEVSRELAQQCLDLANHEGVPTLSVMGHFLLGSCNFHLGRLEGSKMHLDHTLAAFSGGSHPALAMFAGPDVGVFCRSYQSHVLWHLGNAEQAARKSEEALAAARQVSHPFSMAIALVYAALLHVFHRESERALARAEEAVAVCRKHGFAYYLSVAEILAGWAMAMSGDAETGVARLRGGLETFRASGAELRLPFYHGLLAEACARAGHLGEALANISTGFAFQGKNGEVWAAADLHRIHGDLLLLNQNPLQAQASYQRSLDTARLAGAHMYELRAVACLYELENAGSPRV